MVTRNTCLVTVRVARYTSEGRIVARIVVAHAAIHPYGLVVGAGIDGEVRTVRGELCASPVGGSVARGTGRWHA